MAQYGAINIDGARGDWTAADRLDAGGGAAPGYALYGKVVGGAFVLALDAGATTIGSGTTFWFNTDLNASTGYKVWDWAFGAEFNLNFSSAGASQSWSRTNFPEFPADLLTTYPLTPKMDCATFNSPEAILPLEPAIT